GPSGVSFCQQALDLGHEITVYGRNPLKLPVEIREHPKFHSIQGELGDESDLEQAAICGASALVSFLGPNGGPHEGSPVTDCYKTLLPLLIQANYKRAIILCTAAWTAPEDEPAAGWAKAIEGVRSFNANYTEEMRKVGDYVSSIPTRELQWTIFRAPYLSNGEILPVREGFTSEENQRFHLTRESMAWWVLKQLDRDTWVGKGPILGN
ncbi:hypothetical protein BKA56DRAFT_710023, partial [Ilyonectria sp. MPI-CAGE-AT-0026]